MTEPGTSSCPRCAVPLIAAAKFCQACGSPAPPAPAPDVADAASATSRTAEVGHPPTGATSTEPRPELAAQVRHAWDLRSRRGYVAVGVLVIALTLVGVIVTRGHGTSTQPAGQLLPTPATVDHGADVRLLSCHRGDAGTADIVVAMTNSTTTPTDFRVTVAISEPSSGRAYDAVVASYSQLDPHQSLSIEALGTIPVPRTLACQVQRVQLEQGA